MMPGIEYALPGAHGPQPGDRQTVARGGVQHAGGSHPLAGRTNSERRRQRRSLPWMAVSSF
eukprot:4112348-Pyramimonas_sp.AAC.1